MEIFLKGDIYYALNNKQDFNFDLWEEQQNGQRKRKSR